MRQALPITVDKSFAQAASASALAELAAHWVLVVPSAFYWEIFTTDPVKRVRTLEGMPEFRRVHLPKLLRKETETGKPIVALNTPRLQVSDDLRAATWSPNAQQSSILDRYRKQSVEFALDFWKQVILARRVPGFSSDELLDVHDSNGAFAALCKKLNDRERIRNIALEIGFSHAAKIDQRWLWFRLLQAWALHGLVLLRRYPNPRSGIPSEKRMEHDVQDIEYLILALHAGALATRDESPKLKKASLAWRFKLLEPRGVLRLLPQQQKQGTTGT